MAETSATQQPPARGRGRPTRGVVLQGIDPPERFLEIVRLAEREFDQLWMTDSSLHTRNPYMALTLAARETERLKLGTAVTNPVTRHPAITAVNAATLDEVSDGRFILGIGVGDRPLLALGLEPARLGALEESIGVVRRLLTGERVDHAGDHFNLVDAHLRFPARSDLPIYISASGPKTLELAGRIADGVILLCGMAPRLVEWALEHVDRGAAAAGRPRPQIAIFAYGVIDEDEERALTHARPIAAWFPQTAPAYCDLMGLDPAITAQVRALYHGGEFQEAAAAAEILPDEFVRSMAMAGGRDRVTAQLADLVDAGVDQVNVFALGDDRFATIRAFSECCSALGLG